MPYGENDMAAKRIRLVALTIALVSVVGATQVRANSAAPGWYGKPARPADLNCFVSVASLGAAVQNTCGGENRDWDSPLPITNAGSHAVTVTYTGAATLICTVFGFNQFGSVFSQNTVSNLNLSQGTIVPTASLPAGGSLMLRCTMSQGARITNINYNP